MKDIDLIKYYNNRIGQGKSIVIKNNKQENNMKLKPENLEKFKSIIEELREELPQLSDKEALKLYKENNDSLFEELQRAHEINDLLQIELSKAEKLAEELQYKIENPDSTSWF